MKKMKEIKTVTYDAGDGFLVDIVERTDDRNGIEMYEAWIYRSNNGVKQHIVGMMKSSITKREFVNLIANTIEDDKEDYDNEDAFIEYAHNTLDDGCVEVDDGCCPVCGSDDVEVIQYKETEDDVKRAEELKGQYAQFVRDHLVTERFGERVNEFIDYKINNCGTGWWVGLNDAGMLFDMTIIAQDFAGWVHMDD